MSAFRICFLFNAQSHQVMHGMGAAVRLAHKRGIEVDVVSPYKANLELAKEITAKLGGAPIRFTELQSRVAGAVNSTSRGTIGTKKVMLSAARRMLEDYDAIAVPERTSLALRKMGHKSPLMVHLDHGAGDRAVGFEDRIAEFDFVLVAGKKQRERMLRTDLIRPDHFAVAGYSKFEVADAIRDSSWRPFQDDRPIVLYTPHYTALGSWEKWGWQVLERFARQSDFNLVFAPHVRLFGRSGARQDFEKRFAALRSNGRIFVDLGSRRSVDMTYVELADVYLGDVSSQVYEFIRRPRPCAFLNTNGVKWEGDENYAHWDFGTVADSPDAILDVIEEARRKQPQYLLVQQAAFARTFDQRSEPPSERAAGAIARYLRREVPSRRLRIAREVRKGFSALGRTAAVLLLVGLGWSARGYLMPPDSVQHTLAMEADEARDQFAALVPALARAPDNFSPATLATMPAVPSLPSGWRMISSNVMTTEVGPLVEVDVITDNGLPIVMVSSSSTTPADGRLVISSGDDEEIASWSDANSNHALAAHTSAASLRELVRQLSERRSGVLSD